MTVLGPLSPDDLGITLPHEHIFIDVSCWYLAPTEASQIARVEEPVRLDNLWWVKQNLFCNKDNFLLSDVRESTEEVMEYKRYGGGSIVDVTNLGIGRDPLAIRDVSIETGVNVIMGSGYYVGLSHPPEFSNRKEEEITEEIVRDVVVGVGNTGIRAGIIGEIGIEDIEKNRDEEKSLRAAVRAQKETGAPLTIHPPFDRQCERIIEILEEEGADLERVIMCHSELFYEDTLEYTLMIADAGFYIEYDTWGFEGNWPRAGLVEPSDTQRLKGIEKLIRKGHLDQLLLSQDVCNKVMSMAYGGSGRAHILRDCLTLFNQAGITGEEIHRMLVENPKRILQFV